MEREDATQLRLIVDSIPAMSIVYDEDLRCLFANRGFAEYFGFTTASILGRHVREVIGEAAYREVKPHFDRVLGGGRSSYQRAHALESGELRHIEVVLTPRLDESGRSRGLFAVTTDVTDRRRDEELRQLGHAVAELIAGADSSRAAVQAVIRAICETEHWDCGRYFRPSADGRVVRLAESWGVEDASIREFLERSRTLSYEPGSSLIGEVWRSGEPRWVTVVAEDPRALRKAYTDELAAGGAFVFPVRAEGKVIGVLTFNSRRRREPDERLLQVILDIGGQIGQFLERKRAEEQLREAQRATQELIEALPNPIFFKGTDGRYLGVNKAWEKYFATPRQAFVGKTVHDLYPEDRDIADRLHAMDEALWASPGTQVYETAIRTPDGQDREAIYYKATFTQADGSVGGLIGTIIDITERKRAEEELRHFRAAMDVSGDAILLVDRASLRYIDVNRTFCEMVGYARDEILRMSPIDLIGVDRATLESDYDALIADAGGRASKIEAFYQRKDGTRIPIETTRRALQVRDGWIIVGSSRDITERRQTEERMRHMAAHDSLTGLPNRVLFADRLTQAISMARRDARQCALLYLDLDRFKPVNDTYGHDTGDRLLKRVAERLRGVVRESDTVARVGGDEFTVLLLDIASPQNAVAVAEKILQTLTTPFRLDGREIRIGTSIGVAFFPADAEDPDTLIKKADAAMYGAKTHGVGFRLSGVTAG
jgi:diguanylate cyclase (GGDEF)-like protein/PAS domain S-box-containing protein